MRWAWVRAIDAVGSKVKLVAIGDGSRLGYEAIKAGEVDGSVCTRPKLLGALMFKALFEAATNPKTATGRYIAYDMPLITQKTIDACPERW